VRDLIIPRQILDEMIAEAKRLAPHECCGYLAGRDGRVTHHYKIKNVIASEGAELNFEGKKLDHLQSLSPEKRAEIAFLMDAQDMSFAHKDMRSKQMELLVIYHSHPRDPARPSITDMEKVAEFEALRKVLNLPEPLHLIISLQTGTPTANAFRIVGENVTPVPFQIS
jgi:proteasome lid subunit RPN8/RPN11